MALDVLRALTREPASVAAFATELDLARGADPRLDAAITRTQSAVRAAAGSRGAGVDGSAAAQTGARALVEQLATTLQACLLTRFAPAYLSEAFVASRLDAGHGHTFGTLPSDLVDACAADVIDRAFLL